MWIKIIYLYFPSSVEIYDGGGRDQEPDFKHMCAFIFENQETRELLFPARTSNRNKYIRV